LLKLRKVELVGFKSFCEKTQITFSGSGLTCIIGPNGCGKSNIVDAISWVLGEQSHKSLRAERMSDCIFNGTAKRPPLGLAEVTLTLIDPDLAEAAEFVLGPQQSELAAPGPVGVPDSAYGATSTPFNVENTEKNDETVESTDAVAAQGTLAESEDSKEPAFLKKKRTAAEKHTMRLKPGEVVVGRRLYRSGQSEYLINGRVARLRDIQDLFMGIGLGPDSYAIIEQGRIGQILSSDRPPCHYRRSRRNHKIQNQAPPLGSQTGILQSKSFSRQRHLRRSREAAGIPEATSLEGSPLLRNPRTNARHVATGFGEQSQRTRP
jgi:chromosome segregation protein